MMNLMSRIVVGLLITGAFIPLSVQAQSLGANGENVDPFKVSLNGASPCAELAVSMTNGVRSRCADDDGCIMRLTDVINGTFSRMDWVQMSISIPTISLYPYLARIDTLGGGGKNFIIGDGDPDTLIATHDDGACRIDESETEYDTDLVMKACIENSICTFRIDD